MFGLHRSPRPLQVDSNSNVYSSIHNSEPSINVPSSQLCIDLGMDPLNMFAQSNRSCSILLKQLVSSKTELAARQGELAILREQVEVASAQKMLQLSISGIDLRQVRDNLASLQNYIFELESKIRQTKADLVSQLEITSTQVVNRAMHSLVADKLVTWLVKQKLVCSGSRAAIKAHYGTLEDIDIQFEECGRHIVDLMNLLVRSEQANNTPGDIPLYSKIHKLRVDLTQCSRQFVWQSIIVSVQPPAVIVKCRVSDSHRSTRFPCKTELRILGGKALGVRDSFKTVVGVDLISEDMARQIQQDPCKSAIKDPSFNLIYNESRFQADYSTNSSYNYPIYRAVFDRIRLIENTTTQKRTATESKEKKGTRRSRVSSLRYYLAFRVQTGLFLQNCQEVGVYGQPENSYVDVSGYKLSLPVAALVHSSLEAEASLFWNRAFSRGTGILSSVPDSVSWEQAKVALNLKWSAIVTEPQDVRDLMIDLPEPRSLSTENLDHLASRLGIVDGILHKKNFFNKAIAQKENKGGSPLPCVFYEWFYKCGISVNRYMSVQWNDGCIMGFCSKGRSEEILRATIQPTMLIRFSDLIVGYLKISCRVADNRIVHYETEAEKMPLGTSIADAIRQNPTFFSIQHIYPNKKVSLLWQGREKVEDSRATWSGVSPTYFDRVYPLESKPVAVII